MSLPDKPYRCKPCGKRFEKYEKLVEHRLGCKRFINQELEREGSYRRHQTKPGKGRNPPAIRK